ncbi:unnamed protein product [Blepharisma stoltei]|uniref:EF-hand domain-containing protein n=1 Tax=Blepharisma stoltei TaxID=1481888 RepID=A0AAU9IWV5_9CILI|nr:unnamed protein product [Blepharisma stoltei]
MDSSSSEDSLNYLEESSEESNEKYYYQPLSTPELARDEERKERNKRSKSLKEGTQKIMENRTRTWLKKHGKKNYIDFDEKMRNELRKYFLSMDEDGSGSIGVEELMEPMLALGLAENKEQVQTLFNQVDKDHSGEIEFNEFLSIVRRGEHNSPIGNFFQGITSGKIMPGSKNLPFKLVVSNYRRKMIMEAVMGNDLSRKVKGERIMKATAKLLEAETEKLRTQHPEYMKRKTMIEINRMQKKQ